MSAKLFIICGHGAGDPGACAGGESEADLVRQLAKRIKARGGSAVQVGDTSVNWYASDYISKGKCPKGVPVVELHMDSASASAKGGHVIIKSGFSPDEYDKALEKFIKGFFPGRSVTLSKRSDLANPNRAGRMGVNYRLVENGFISNSGDRKKFIEHMDELADGYLAAFGIKSNGSSAGSSSTSKPSGGTTSSKPKWQTAYGDPEWFGPKMAKAWQQQLGTVADGVISGQPMSNKEFFWAVSGGVAYGSSGSDAVLALQKGLKAAGYDPNGLDRYYGKGCIEAHQKWLKKLGYYAGEIDGYHGHETNEAMCKALAAGAYKKL